MLLLLLRNVKLGMNTHQKTSVALLQANIFIFRADIKLGIIWQHLCSFTGDIWAKSNPFWV